MPLRAFPLVKGNAGGEANQNSAILKTTCDRSGRDCIAPWDLREVDARRGVAIDIPWVRRPRCQA